MQEVKISTDILLEAECSVQRISLIIHRNVEWLGISTKLACLQVAPLVADGSQCTLFTIESHLHRL